MTGTRLSPVRRRVLWGGTCAVVLAAAAGCAASSTASRHATGQPAARPSGSAARPAAVASPSVQRAATSPSGPAAQAPVVNIGSYTGRAPSVIDFSADGGNVVTGIRWLSWTARGATGRGTSAIESCVPDCAQGPVTYVPTTITFSAPLDGEFTVLAETRAGRTMTFRYPVFWPLAAS